MVPLKRLDGVGSTTTLCAGVLTGVPEGETFALVVTVCVGVGVPEGVALGLGVIVREGVTAAVGEGDGNSKGWAAAFKGRASAGMEKAAEAESVKADEDESYTAHVATEDGSTGESTARYANGSLTLPSSSEPVTSHRPDVSEYRR
jgi:hypothetical protein